MDKNRFPKFALPYKLRGHRDRSSKNGWSQKRLQTNPWREEEEKFWYTTSTGPASKLNTWSLWIPDNSALCKIKIISLMTSGNEETKAAD